jgi:hypothetical protein
MEADQKMCKWEQIREEIIAERAEEWQKLLCSKSEFDKEAKKRKVGPKKKPKKQRQETGPPILRRSFRNTKQREEEVDLETGKRKSSMETKKLDFLDFTRKVTVKSCPVCGRNFKGAMGVAAHRSAARMQNSACHPEKENRNKNQNQAVIVTRSQIEE